MENESALLRCLSQNTGIEWEAVDGDPAVMGGAWQLMPYDPGDDGPFWFWHLANARQVFATLEEAAA